MAGLENLSLRITQPMVFISSVEWFTQFFHEVASYQSKLKLFQLDLQWKHEPTPVSDTTHILPPWTWTILLQTDNPIPNPEVPSEVCGSLTLSKKILFCSLKGIPAPLSQIVISTH